MPCPVFPISTRFCQRKLLQDYYEQKRKNEEAQLSIDLKTEKIAAIYIEK
jgi:hypothetical protein